MHESAHLVEEAVAPHPLDPGVDAGVEQPRVEGQLVLTEAPDAARLAVREVVFTGPSSIVVLEGAPGLRPRTGSVPPSPGDVVGVAVTGTVRWLPGSGVPALATPPVDAASTGG